MWSLTLRDLRFRRRRFIIAIAGTALVFGMALVMSGMSAGFRVEADRTLDAVGADAWVAPAGLAGPFTTFAMMPAETVGQVGQAAGVRQADPLIVLRLTIAQDGTPTDVNVIGHRAGGLGEPRAHEGRRAAAPGEAVVDRRTGVGLGERFVMNGRTFTAVGRMRGITYLAGIPVIFVSLADAQALAFEGRDFITSVVTRGIPGSVPAGYAVMDRAVAREDLMRPLANGIKTIDSTQYMLWLVAAFIIGAVVYLSALERVRDFAVLKAVGASSGRLYGSLAAQAILLSLVAAGLGSAIASALAPTFPLPIAIPGRAFAILPVVALGVGFLASLTGLKKAIDVDPALAFGSV